MSYTKKLLPLLCAAYLTACATNQQLSDSGAASLQISPAVNPGATADSMYQLGRYYQGQSRYDQAITAYQKSLTVDSSEAEAHNGLGVVYSKLGKFDAAIEAFEAALKLSPQAAHIYNNLGYAYYLQGNDDQALASLKQALALAPDNKRVQTNLDLVYERTGSANRVSAPVDTNAMPAESSVTQHRVSPQEDSGTIIRAVDPALKVVQIAPAVYQLERVQAAPQVTAAKTDLSNLGLEVSNGNGITGMARKVGAFLRHLGYATARLTNQKPFRVTYSEVQYRSGYLQQAEKLQAEIAGQPKLVQRDDLRSGTNLRLVLGKDLVDDQDYFSAR